MRKLGNLCIFLGVLLIAGSAVLFAMNQQENAEAGAQSAEVMAQIEAIAQQKNRPPAFSPVQPTEPPKVPDPYNPAMTEIKIAGHSYIGYLHLPSLEDPLPVMSSWSMTKLKTAPCRYYGSTKTNDLVLLAHNFPKHFGTLKDLTEGERIYFTDMDGIVTEYQVMAKEILSAEAVLDMISGEYDLTLFTCTYGGENRVTIRCDRVVDP